MIFLWKRVVPTILFTVVGLSASRITSYAQGCKLQAATRGTPSKCVAVSATGKCSPVDTGTGSSGMCKKVPGAEECTCAEIPETPPKNPGLDHVPLRPPRTPAAPDDAPLTGFVDLHTHPLSNLGFGGKLLYGGVDVGSLLPSDPSCQHNVRATSESQALGNDNSTHGGWDLFHNGCGDMIRANIITVFETANDAAPNEKNGGALGYPNFPDWPVWNDITHQKMWVEWIRRAHTGGLNVMVALAVNNKTLGDMTAGPGDYPTNDKSSADLQIAEIKSFVGRHSDFMEVALNSADVYRIVSAKRLAVVIGIEVDHIGNLTGVVVPMVGVVQPPSEADLKAEIHRLYAEGVRYIFPIHVLDNALGGAAAYQSIFDASNMREEGRPYALVCANLADTRDSDLKDGAHGGFTYDNNALSFLNVVAQLGKTGFAVTSIQYPQCPSGVGQKNSLGLTPSGTAVITEMMKLGMLIDIDHMSQAAADATLTLATRFSYPVNSGHSGVRGALQNQKNHNERSVRPDQYMTIGRLHGMAGVGSSGLDAQQWVTLYNQVTSDMGAGGVGAFGSDTDGFALGMPPRRKTCRPQFIVMGTCMAPEPASSVQYPIQLAALVPQGSGILPVSTDGTKTWDYNVVGVAHFGMFPDFLMDVKSLPGGDATVKNIMTGADYFYRTWKIAETNSTTVR